MKQRNLKLFNTSGIFSAKVNNLKLFVFIRNIKANSAFSVLKKSGKLVEKAFLNLTIVFLKKFAKLLYNNAKDILYQNRLN